MTKTSTLVPDQTLKTTEKPAKPEIEEEPSLRVINNILNFSRNLEIKPSRLVERIEILRS